MLYQEGNVNYGILQASTNVFRDTVRAFLRLVDRLGWKVIKERVQDRGRGTK